MDPVTMAALAAAATTAGSAAATAAPIVAAGATAIGAYSSHQSQKSQAAHMQQSAAIEADNADIRAKEATALGQQKAGARRREARLAQSNLKANAGASGSSSSDPTVMNLWEGIEEEGQHNANMETASAGSQAAGIKYQSDLNSWTADSNAQIKKAGASSTIIGGFGDAAGSFSRMRGRYGGFQGGTSLAYPGSSNGGKKTTVRYG